MSRNAEFRVWRGDATGGGLQDYTVEVNEGEVVLDIIHRLQATQAGDLAVRWNCKAGKCGSCSAEINGRPRLLCMTRMSTFTDDEVITVTPMRSFPVIRDLVTDVSFNYQKARQIPAFRPAAGPRARRALAGIPQVHRMLPESLPRAHPHHRQRHHPDERTGGRPQVRPAGVARQQAVPARRLPGGMALVISTATTPTMVTRAK
jgi:ferredoxin